jgi:hypothetical protein
MDDLVSRALAWVRAEPDRTVGGALVVLGAVLLVLTYVVVDSDPVIVDQLSTLTLGGVGGLLLVGVGSMVLVLSDLADEWHKLDRIEAVLEGREPAGRRPGLLGLEARLRPPMALGGIGTLAGAVVVLVAWHRATGESDPKDGFSAVALAVGGLVGAATAVLSSTFWFVRIVRLRASRLFAPWMVEDLQARVEAAGARRGWALAEQSPSLPATVMVGGGLRRFHLAGCGVLATGGPYDEVALASAPRRLSPCGLCLPELSNGHRPAGEGVVAR